MKKEQIKKTLITIKNYIVANKFAFIYLALAMLMEIVAQVFVGARPYIVQFWLPLMVLTVVVLILLSLRTQKMQNIMGTVFLFVQAILIFAGVFLYNSNGAAFQHDFFNMRNDAFGTMEHIDVQPGLVALLLITISVFIALRIVENVLIKKGILKKPDSLIKAEEELISSKTEEEIMLEVSIGEEVSEVSIPPEVAEEILLEAAATEDTEELIQESTVTENKKSGKKKKKKLKIPLPPLTKREKIAMWTLRGAALLFVVLFTLAPIIDGVNVRRQPNYHFKLTRMDGDRNQMRGITTNILYETVVFGSARGVDTSESYRFQDILNEGGPTVASEFFGVCAGNNLVVILAESFDTFLLEYYSIEKTRELFPNIMRIVDGGVNATNFRGKEKTDTAEALVLVGSNPTQGFLHYDFARNAFPYSLPAKMGHHFRSQGYEDYQLYAFHANRASFYNRDVFFPALGFQRYWGMADMVEHGVEDTWGLGFWGTFGSGRRGERVLDSEVVYHMRDQMFPADKPFHTFFMTMVKHGFYRERLSLRERGYFDRLDEMEMFPYVRRDTMRNYLRVYAAAALDFDRALGLMLEDLEEKGILDTTTIVIFADHEAYYHDLSGHIKADIRNRETGQQGPRRLHRLDPERFRIPMMFYCKSLNQRFDELIVEDDERENEGEERKHYFLQKYNGENRQITRFTATQDILPTILDIFGIRGWKNVYFGHSMFQNEYESIVFSRVYNFFMNDRMAFFSKNNIDFRTPAYQDGDLDVFVERAKIHLDKLFWLDRMYFSNFFASNPYLYPGRVLT